MSGSTSIEIAPIPQTRADLLAQRVIKHTRSILDRVEELHIRAIENPDYRRYLNATSNASAVEGHLTADDFQAALILRAMAEEAGDDIVAKLPLWELVKKMRSAWKRTQVGRKQRILSITSPVAGTGD